ncbi:MAG TPA: trehalose-phosphatase [Stellaceae bacterium]|nr:trehalose-phosphatase [Stellaceae bacterium]
MCNAQEIPECDPQAALFLDLDGTLIEIAARPDRVRVPAGLPALLDDLSREREGALAVVSGRALADIDRLLAPWRGAAAGLHGGERRRADATLDLAFDERAARSLVRLRPRLAALAAGMPGVFVEDKGGALAVHYRTAPAREGALRAAARALSAEFAPALQFGEGKMAFEFRPPFASKGTAIAAFLAEPPFRGKKPIFVGDDLTDEDGFAEVNRRGGLAIRVGALGGSAARFVLPSVAAALSWLAAGRGG